jgi:hypothetical protein
MAHSFAAGPNERPELVREARAKLPELAMRL